MDTIKIRAYSKSELASMYGISTKLLRNWLKKIPNLGVTPAQKILMPNQVKLVFDTIGVP